MPFIPHTEEEIRQMLDTLGASSIDELFDEIPAALVVPERLDSAPAVERKHHRFVAAPAMDAAIGTADPDIV